MLMRCALQYQHYKGIVLVAPVKRLLLKSWYPLLLEITGAKLIIESLPTTTEELASTHSVVASSEGLMLIGIIYNYVSNTSIK